MRAKMSRSKFTYSGLPTLERVLADAIDQGLAQVVGEMTPRQYVELRTMSSFELGLKFKQLVRDEMYERGCEAMKKSRYRVSSSTGK